MKQSHLLRLNKAIAACGFCSRRNADSFIADGQVKVNGKIVKDFHLLINLDKDAIDVAGKKLSARQKEYVILHKPRAFISTCQDEFERQKIIDLLPKNLKHLKPAGRLDYDSTGLILLTNDGLLTNSLIHPKNEIEKTYKIIVAGKITAQALKELSSGIHLKEAKTKSAKVRLIKCSDKESNNRNYNQRRQKQTIKKNVCSTRFTGIAISQNSC